ncbi:MAG: hypothetical protein PHP44_08770, partial [Kiritimatiellae bacterium]|nr:hypothetical protein [Kiritimatiellia bacterium]
MTTYERTHEHLLPPEQMEKYSSAITLSDMEIFIFPELMFSLVLANIMSPRIWAWRDHPWFRKLDKLTTYRKILRLKQFIIDQYDFNLDLETWGLTTQEREMARFRDHVDEKTLSQSNALFGYEGDKYYFDIDIRRHFGLDKYTQDTIPYWKTETIEAMDAFCHKTGYAHGAGECVSLATLYAAALYVICDIPLEDIFLLATPLHSQNFVDVKEGVLTNNRRILTKAMWFNGTELTEKAQRALRNERVTIVTHSTGYIHTVYPEATMDPTHYERFASKLEAFTTAAIDREMIVNFLRRHSEFQQCFQLEQECHGRRRYLPLEIAFHYEHSSSFQVNVNTRDRLLDEVDEYQWNCELIEGRVLLSKMENFFAGRTIEFEDKAGHEKLLKEFDCKNEKAPQILETLLEFIHLKPRLPVCERFVPTEPIRLKSGMTREEVVACIHEARGRSTVADLAFYAYRDLSVTDWGPFTQAALERNPVCVEAVRGWELKQILEALEAMPNESIYDGSRTAQPDEVWNFGRWDGLKRAFCLAAILKNRDSSL